MVQEGVDGLLVPVHDGEHTVGQAGLLPQLGEESEGDGSFSLGLRTNALPQAMALAHIHSGTMTGS